MTMQTLHPDIVEATMVPIAEHQRRALRTIAKIIVNTTYAKRASTWLHFERKLSADLQPCVVRLHRAFDKSEEQKQIE